MLPHDMVTISYKEEFVTVPSPVNPNNVKQWTATQRLKAMKAENVTTIEDLRKEVSIYFARCFTIILNYF